MARCFSVFVLKSAVREGRGVQSDWQSSPQDNLYPLYPLSIPRLAIPAVAKLQASTALYYLALKHNQITANLQQKHVKITNKHNIVSTTYTFFKK